MVIGDSRRIVIAVDRKLWNGDHTVRPLRLRHAILTARAA